MSATNVLRAALAGIWANKLRTTLTMLGVIIGVTATINVLALGNGARVAVESNFRYLGADVLQISPKLEFEDGEMKPAGRPLTFQEGLDLSVEVPLISQVEMNITRTARLRFGRAVVELQVQGVTADVFSRLALGHTLQPTDWPPGAPITPEDLLEDGRFFTSSEVLAGEQICVLGQETALDLFGGADSLGQTIWVERARCRVIGVLRELETVDPNARAQSQVNQTVYLPISAVITHLFDDEPSVQIVAHAADEKRMQETKTQIQEYLRREHNIEMDEDGFYADDFQILTRLDVLGAQLAAARTFALLLTALAIVSLLVGGIGIMNVMLVSVSERTREIGVRLAVGARPRDIIYQFLLEAVLISAGGGLCGVLAGSLSIPLARALNNGVALLAPASIPAALGMALFTGLFFGLYPAVRAARLDPIQALRYE